MTSLDYTIIQSGSAGNAVRIEDIMIDCGVSYSKMKDELYKCKLLFITHKHSDHLKLNTFAQIKKHHRFIKVIANYDVAQIVNVDFILSDNPKKIRTKAYEIEAFLVPHDVVTHGLAIHFNDGREVIYVTDSAGTKTWIKGKYDYLFIESNHDEVLLKTFKPSDFRYDYLNGSMRHTSKQESKAFYYLNRKNKGSEWIELHKSERFYR